MQITTVNGSYIGGTMTITQNETIAMPVSVISTGTFSSGNYNFYFTAKTMAGQTDATAVLATNWVFNLATPGATIATQLNIANTATKLVPAGTYLFDTWMIDTAANYTPLLSDWSLVVLPTLTTRD